MATIGKNLENIEKQSNHHSPIDGSGGAVHGGLDGQPLLVHHQHPRHLPCHLNKTKMSKIFLLKVKITLILLSTSSIAAGISSALGGGGPLDFSLDPSMFPEDVDNDDPFHCHHCHPHSHSHCYH